MELRPSPSRPDGSPAVRIWVNRLLAGVVLVGALLAIAVVARFRPGRARPMVLAVIRLACLLTGVRVATSSDRDCGTSGGPPLDEGSGPRVYVANHSSPLDIPAVLLARPDVTFVAGADLFRIPLLAGAMRALDTIPVDRSGQGAGRLSIPPHRARGHGRHLAVVVFPEGGIAPAGQRLAFKRGAFASAIELGADVVPVAIHHTARVLPPRSWLGVRPGRVVVELLDPIRTTGMSLDDRAALAERAKQRILDALGPADGGRRPDCTAPIARRTDSPVAPDQPVH